MTFNINTSTDMTTTSSSSDMMMMVAAEESRRSSLQSIQTRKTTNSSRKMTDFNSSGDCSIPGEVVSKDDAPLRPCRRVSDYVTLDVNAAVFDEVEDSDSDYSDSDYDSDSDSECEEEEGPTLEDLGYGVADTPMPTSDDLGYGEEPSCEDLGYGEEPSCEDLGYGEEPSCEDLGYGEEPSSADLGYGEEPSSADLGYGEDPPLPKPTLARGTSTDSIPTKPMKRLSTNKPLRNKFSIYGGVLGDSDCDFSDDSDYSVSDDEDEEEDDFFGGDCCGPIPSASSHHHHQAASSSMMNAPRRISMDYGYQEDNPSMPTRVDLQYGNESDEVPCRISLQFNSSSNSCGMDSSDRSSSNLRNGRLEVSIGTSGLKRQVDPNRLTLCHSTTSLQQSPVARATLTRRVTMDLGSVSYTPLEQQQPQPNQRWSSADKRTLTPREQQALRRRATMDLNSSSTTTSPPPPQRGITRNISSRPQRRITMDHHTPSGSSFGFNSSSHHRATPAVVGTPERRITRNTSSRPMRRTTMDHYAPKTSSTNDLSASSTHSRTAPPQRGVNRYASSRPMRRTTMDHHTPPSSSSTGDLSASSTHSRTAPQSRGINRYTSSRQLPMRRTTMDHHAPVSSISPSSSSSSQRSMMGVQRSPSMSHYSSSGRVSSPPRNMTCDHNGRLLATDLKQISPALSNKGGGGMYGTRRISMDTSKSTLGRVHPTTVAPSSASRRGRVLPQRNRSMGGRAA